MSNHTALVLASHSKNALADGSHRRFPPELRRTPTCGSPLMFAQMGDTSPHSHCPHRPLPGAWYERWHGRSGGPMFESDCHPQGNWPTIWDDATGLVWDGVGGWDGNHKQGFSEIP